MRNNGGRLEGTIEFSPEIELLPARIGWDKGDAGAQTGLSDPESDCIESQLPKNKNTYGKCPERPDRALTKRTREPALTDPELVQLRNVWPTLPQYLKAAILALASTERSPGGQNT